MSSEDNSKSSSKTLVFDSDRLRDFENQIHDLMQSVKEFESSSSVPDSAMDVESNEGILKSELFAQIRIYKKRLDSLEGVNEKNKELISHLEHDNKNLKDEMEKFGKLAQDLKEKYHASLDKKNNELKLKKNINSLSDDLLEMKSQNNELKKLVSEKDNSVNEYITSLSSRDTQIRGLNSQILLLKSGKDVIDDANRKIIGRVDSLSKTAKSLNGQLTLKDDEISNVRKMLAAEKELSDRKIKHRLKDFAEKESRKDVLLNGRLKEFGDIIIKQRILLNDVSKADEDIFSKFNDMFKDIKEKRSELDYGIVEKELDTEVPDIASLNRIIAEIGTSVGASSGTSGKVKKSGLTRLESGEIDMESPLALIIKDALKGGDPEDLIKRGLLKKGYDEGEVGFAIDAVRTELNVNI